jgi:hypothetical protein
VGGEHLARPGGVAQAAGDDDRCPVEVAALRQRLAGVDADAHLQAVGRAGRRALEVARAAHRRDGAREGHHEPVARRLDLVSTVGGHDRAQHREVPRAPGVGLLVAVAVVERRRADDVGEHDRDERRLHDAEHLRRFPAACHPSG